MQAKRLHADTSWNCDNLTVTANYERNILRLEVGPNEMLYQKYGWHRPVSKVRTIVQQVDEGVQGNIPSFVTVVADIFPQVILQKTD